MGLIKFEGFSTHKHNFNIKGKELLVLNDIHFPFHDKKALNIALEYLSEVDTLLLNGDITDFYGLSRFVKNPMKSFIKDEIEQIKEFFTEVRKVFQGNIIYKIGNHENRLMTYICNNAPALYDVESVSFKSLFDLEKFKVKEVESTQLMTFSSLYIFHGHELFGGAGMVNIARAYFLKCKENIMFGHRHQTQDYIDKSLNGKIKGSWSIGCLSDLNPDYMTINNWNHGFARVSKHNENEFSVKNYQIIKGKVF